jgi:hypothetical protein
VLGEAAFGGGKLFEEEADLAADVEEVVTLSIATAPVS